MEHKEFLEYQGKRIKVVLQNRYYYTGFITEFHEDFFLFKDKVGKNIKMVYSFVALIEEVDG